MDGTRLPGQGGAQASPLADAGSSSAWIDGLPGETLPFCSGAVAAARRVLVFRRDLLPLSETFVRQQVLGLREWQATLIGHRRVSGGLDLSGSRAYLVGADIGGWRDLVAWNAFRLCGWPVPPPLRALLDTGAALVHVHFATDAVSAWPWLRHLHLPVVITLHGYDITIDPEWWAAGEGGAAQRDYPDRLRALASESRVSFIAVSEAIRQRAIAAYGIPAGKIKVLHIGVDNAVFTPGPVAIGARAPRVLFVGRQVEKKGLPVLILAMRQVQRQLPEAELVVVGDGPLYESSAQMAAGLGINARFLGAQPSTMVRQLLDEARVLCLPSITAANGDAEGFGLVLLEAQACGVPVVTSAKGGREEGVRHGITGFAFAEGDHAALVDHLLKILTDDALATSMGREAVRFVAERFSLAECILALERYYTRLSDRRAR